MNFTAIPPESLHTVWPDVLLGLHRIKDKSPERWLPEDLYAHIKIGRARLHLAYDSDIYRGFFVTELCRDTFTNDLYLNVWVLFMEPQLGQSADVKPFVPQAVAFVDDLARAAKAKWVACQGRAGWTKFLAGYFTPTTTRYERML